MPNDLTSIGHDQAWKAKAMRKVMYGELEITDRLIHGFRLNYNELVEHGFHLQ